MPSPAGYRQPTPFGPSASPSRRALKPPGSGDAPAELAARHFVMLRDGAMAAGCLFDPALICETFLRRVDGLLQAHAAPGHSGPVASRR